MPEYCYHCGGELEEGVSRQLVPTETAPADPRPGRPCCCEEIPDNTGETLRISDPIIADWNLAEDDEKD